jgi:hypothetical protein
MTFHKFNEPWMLVENPKIKHRDRERQRLNAGEGNLMLTIELPDVTIYSTVSKV